MLAGSNLALRDPPENCCIGGVGRIFHDHAEAHRGLEFAGQLGSWQHGITSLDFFSTWASLFDMGMVLGKSACLNASSFCLTGMHFRKRIDSSALFTSFKEASC